MLANKPGKFEIHCISYWSDGRKVFLEILPEDADLEEDFLVISNGEVSDSGLEIEIH